MVSSVSAQPNPPQEASLTAQNTFTEPAVFTGSFPVRLRGTWVGTITLQRSDDAGVVYDDVDSWTTNVVRICDEADRGGALFRLGFKTGDFSSGTADVRVG